MKRRAVILTRLLVEYSAVRLHLNDLHEDVDARGIIYEVGTFASFHGAWEVAIAQVGFGSLAATQAAESAVDRYSPAVLLLVGVAAGLQGRVRLGDVVVSTQIYPYQISDEGAVTKLEAVNCSTRLQQRALHESTRHNWLERGITAMSDSPPDVHVGPVVSLLGNASLKFLPRLEGSLALDLEGFQVLRSVLHGSTVEATLILGISDIVGEVKSRGDNAEKLASAAANASAFTFEILSRLPTAAAAERRPSPKASPFAGYISQVKIHNIRSISSTNLRLSKGPGWHVIIGDNGSGKTAILRAIALSLLSRRDADALRQDWSKWVTVGRSKGSMEVLLVGAEGKPVKRSISIDTQASGALKVDGVGRDSQADVFSAGYGPFRRFSGGDVEYEKQLQSWPGLQRYLTLFSEGAALGDGLRWLQDLRFKQLEGSDSPQTDLLSHVKLFISQSELLPQDVRLSEVSSESVFFIDGNGRAVTVQELSDGFRSVLSLVLDLLRHLSDTYDLDEIFSPNDSRFVVASGIVLVDEIDVHLHPMWQHEIGSWFSKHFPNIQFIVTTHSTLICQSADSVYLLPRPGTEEKGHELTSTTLNRIRYGNVLDAYGTGAFGEGVDRSDLSRIMLNRLATLNAKELREELTGTEQREQASLRSMLPTASTVPSSIEEERR